MTITHTNIHSLTHTNTVPDIWEKETPKKDIYTESKTHIQKATNYVLNREDEPLHISKHGT